MDQLAAIGVGLAISSVALAWLVAVIVGSFRSAGHPPSGSGPHGEAVSTIAAGPRRRLRLALPILAVALAWIGLALVRAPGLARDHFAGLEAGRAVSDLETEISPALPPFWAVQVQATVTELGGASYPAAQIVWVEPFSGWAITFGAG